MEHLKEQLPGLDFSSEIEKNPDLEEYIKKECESYVMEFVHPLKHPDAPKLDDNFSNYFMMCGLPKVDDQKKPKLLGVLVKIFGKLQVDFITVDDITMLMNEDTGMSYGTAFVKCKDLLEAKLASRAINSFAIDKKHTIMASTFDEFDRLMKIPDEYSESKFADLLYLYNYAMDPANDQFLVREDNQIYVKMNKIPNSTDVSNNSDEFHEVLVGPGKQTAIKTKKNAEWSPQGLFLIVYQENIVNIYGGAGFDLIREIIHTGVTYAKVSPCERYIYTYSSTADEKEGNFKFWEIFTGELLRQFEFDENTTPEMGADLFSFSYDGNYCAKQIENHVVVYELPSMRVLEDEALQKRVGIRVDGIQKFAWSPSKSMFAYWQLNTKNLSAPPKIGFVEVPSRRVLSNREIVNGVDIVFEWSNDGTKLIAKCKLKRKKEYQNSVAIFDISSSSFPMELINCDYNILAANWITATKRIAILVDRSRKIRQEWVDRSAIAIAVIYDVTEGHGTLNVKFMGQTKEHISNTVEWAKNGNIFVLADTNNKNAAYQGIFHVYYIRTIITKIEVQGATVPKGKSKKKSKPVFEEQREYVVDLLTTIEDNRSDTISWDPTSRFFITGKLKKSILSKSGMSYKIYDSKGDQIFTYSSPKLQQFEWRPRPYRNWTEEEEKTFKKEYKKNLKKKVQKEDEDQRNEMVELLNIERETQKKMFLDIFQPLHDRYKDTKAKRKALLKARYADSDTEDEEEFERVVIIDAVTK